MVKLWINYYLWKIENKAYRKHKSSSANLTEGGSLFKENSDRKISDASWGNHKIGDIVDENIFHRNSQQPAKAMTFFRFSHRNKNRELLTNKEQEAIVDNIYQNIFYLAEHTKPHKNSSTKVPYYDGLLDENDQVIEYTKDWLKKKARYFDEIHDEISKDADIAKIEEKYKMNPLKVSLSIPTFSPFRKGEESHIISETQAIMISRLLPPIIRMREWERIFSLDVDGVSLKTFYNNVHMHTATILVIQDTNGWKFGWYAATDWEIK